MNSSQPGGIFHSADATRCNTLHNAHQGCMSVRGVSVCDRLTLSREWAGRAQAPRPPPTSSHRLPPPPPLAPAPSPEWPLAASCFTVHNAEYTIHTSSRSCCPDTRVNETANRFNGWFGFGWECCCACADESVFLGVLVFFFIKTSLKVEDVACAQSRN